MPCCLTSTGPSAGRFSRSSSHRRETTSGEFLNEAFELSEIAAFVDAIGEIANMIAGNAKTHFPWEGTAISVPSVVVGKHKVSYPSGLPIIAIPCMTDKGKMVIEVALKSNG